MNIKNSADKAAMQLILTSTRSLIALFGIALGVLCGTGCGKPSATKAEPGPAATVQGSTLKIELQSAGQAVITTKTAEFRILPSGYVEAFLLQNHKKLTLDDPGSSALDPHVKTSSTLDDAHFVLNFEQAKVTEASGKLGRGKHLEIPAQSSVPKSANIRRTLLVEAYEDFPNILLTSVEYKNEGGSDFTIKDAIEQKHRLNATLADSRSASYDMWSYQGSSYDWGKDDVLKLPRRFSQPNVMGGIVKGGYGGGIPVIAFWTASVGEAIGHVETLPLSLSLPVKVESDGKVSAAVTIAANTILKPGETYSTPRSFVAIYAGDFYEPLRLWSSVLQKEGWEITKPSSEAYNVSWCGWGYEFNVTPAQMLGTVPKLKEMGIKWATLDDRWFQTYGDWDPRAETFPGNSIKQMVADFHKQGILTQLWWLPLGVEDGQGKTDSHKYVVSKVVHDHPDWLILDKNGKHGRITRNLAALCPAVPEVQAYYKQLTEKFIGDWDFDGSKLDNIYTVPACYNPTHHHKSPQDSVNAVADVYKTIFQTTRALKPQSVTQSCPCGTPPSLAWLPYMDQAVTADPVGAQQVRRRIKVYKALLGPNAAVYGDHVELSAMDHVGNNWLEHGDDFASTIGAGGVVGTKFVWPDPGPKYKAVNLTQEKEQHWKKWISLYNEKMLSKGTFLNLYTYGYDFPEAYAIEKDGRMYYAFFAASEKVPWKGEVALRGLVPGAYHVRDYADGKDLGTINAKEGSDPKLKAEFTHHLLLEVSAEK